jgi:uncharacterized protein (DUF362 family)
LAKSYSHKIKSKIVIAHRNDIRQTNQTISDIAVQKMLDTGIESLYEEKADLVWRKLFKETDTVGLKVNCLAGKGLSTDPVLVSAITERLLKAGVKKKRIIVWDRLNRDLQRAGFKIVIGNNLVQCYGNDHAGFTSDIFEYGAVGSLLSRIIHDQCTAIINVPILKDHGIVGVSVALKNFFGAINNPNKYHDNVGDPYVADVCMFPAIRLKTRLTICDAFSPQYEGGPPFMPQWTWKMNSLILSEDMVAMDQVGWEIIEQKRKENGFKPLTAVGRKPTYIATAADPKHQLGTNDPRHIKIDRV